MSPHRWSWCDSCALFPLAWRFLPFWQLSSHPTSSFLLAVEACRLFSGCDLRGSPGPSGGSACGCHGGPVCRWQGPCFCLWQDLPTYLRHYSLVLHHKWVYLPANVFMVGRPWGPFQVCVLTLLFWRHVSHSDIKTADSKDSVCSALRFLSCLAQSCPSAPGHSWEWMPGRSIWDSHPVLWMRKLRVTDGKEPGLDPCLSDSFMWQVVTGGQSSLWKGQIWPLSAELIFW